MSAETADELAHTLTAAGYDGLFLSGDQRPLETAWRGGDNEAALTDIAHGDAYPDVARVLAAEVLHAKTGDHSPAGSVYARALALSGLADRPPDLAANLWGLMYYADEHGGDRFGALGQRLLEAGDSAVSALAELLDDAHALLYVGSQEATLGNRLRYRVKDAAAYYIGKLAGLRVRFHDEPAARDAEIDRLRAALAQRNGEAV